MRHKRDQIDFFATLGLFLACAILLAPPAQDRVWWYAWLASTIAALGMSCYGVYALITL